MSPVFDPSAIGHAALYRLLTATVVPRPIAFISSMSPESRRNVAPFSFYNVACPWPPILSTAIGRRGGEKKDTWRNIEASGDYVVNVVTDELAEQMNLASGEYPSEVDEFALTGLTPIPSVVVSAPSVAEAKIRMECRLDRIIEFAEGDHGLVLGRIVSITVVDTVWVDGRVDLHALKPVARLAGSLYAHCHDIFSMVRPG